ncbi:MAG: hypothetical protein SPE43_04870, partial [Ruminococcus sp.]|nr:hypothetical protein [Ruminococcus sp.]
NHVYCPNCGTEWYVDDNDEYINDNNDYKKLSVYDASLIWLSKGKDEDYMFGYTEEELENAL